MNKYLKIIISVILPLIIGGIVGGVISQYIDYNELIKPAFSPPSYLFPIAWTIIYLLMGISFTILKLKDTVTEEIKEIYYLQLILNYLWTIIFFVFKFRFLSILWIIVLDVLVAYMIYQFYKKNKVAGIL